MTPRCLYANFVASLDGVVALGAETADPGAVISGHSLADRFVMALLRACADALVVGAGTLRATPGHPWTPESLHPQGAAEFGELRRRLGLPPAPRLVVVTARGDVDLGTLPTGTLILTTADAARSLRERLPRGVDVEALGPGPRLAATGIVETLTAAGHRRVLHEGGPTLLGQFLEAGVVDELFLTASPVLVGRHRGGDRLGLVDGVALSAATAPWLDLLSVRRAGEHLMLRYAVRRRR